MSASTVPLIFLATRAGKTQPNGITPAAGTLEHSVVRTVTSLPQSLQLYGVPSFRKDSAGNEFHGDARNEYGLLALNNFLGVGNRAYVVRANIDLSDERETFIGLGTPRIAGEPSFYGLGSGIMANISAAGPNVKPQEIIVSFNSTSSFAVTGSSTGYIGTGQVSVPFASSAMNFTIQPGEVPFASGDRFTFTMEYAPEAGEENVGTGTLMGLLPGELARPETLTVTFTSQTDFTVTGSVSGDVGDGKVNALFDNNLVAFTAVAGETKFQRGDRFTIEIANTIVDSPLGANDGARRVAIATALQAEINSNTEARSSLYEYNLILCPGYPEVVDELLALSVEIKDEAMVIADTPGNMSPEQVAQWALTSERFSSESAAYYYPWALQSNMDGRNVLGAPSGVALRTLAVSDNAGYVWTPPAGVARGLVTGVSKVGYFTGTPGTATTFVEANLNEGQRDNLYEYDKNINPITFFPGRGLLVWGQKTSAPAASALDRINVVRLVMYLRRSLRKGSMPFVFEPNDRVTRDNLKAAADTILNDILVKRGISDYATYCNEGNNTGDRIDRNELWLDVAIKPMRAAEFIYIPIRVVATSADI
ncbi:phage tail sheath C-terminal domain-containing protein [Acinetobacter sp.]|uniref:phage tail sheath C-terminal domain-containing protein n=1 Tax=Acinetobacter sp. TaxID=472 RepID=UPI00388ECF5F